MTTVYITPLISLIWLGVPFCIIGIGLFFFEHLADSVRLRYALCWLSVLYSWYSIQHPITGPFFNYMTGLMSVYHPVRAVELLISSNPRSMRRLRKVGSFYCWEHLPPAYSFRRLLWIIDILFNPRAIGWAHGPTRHLPPASHILEPGAFRPWKSNNIHNLSRGTFLLTQVRRLVVSYIWLDFYITVFVHANGRDVQNMFGITAQMVIGVHPTPATSQIVYSWVWRIARIISAQYFLDAFHAFLGLVAVGIFTDAWLDTAGEAWTYPTLFGGFHLSKPSLKGKYSMKSRNQ
jgi:hypothetical protein